MKHRFAGVWVIALAVILVPQAAAALDGPTELGEPVITGEARVGEVLTASPADLHRWQRCRPDEVVGSCEPGQGNTANGWQDIEGADGSDAASYELTEADLGLMIRVLAKQTNRGTQYASSVAVGPVVPAEPAAEDEPPAEEEPATVGEPPSEGGSGSSAGGVPPPAFDRTGNLDPVRGQVWVKVPGSDEPRLIEELTQVPVGSQVDVNEGRVQLVTRRKPNGRLQRIELWAGAFVLRQQPAGRMTVLRLVDPLGGSAASRATEVELAARRKRGRKLWGKGKCRCRTKGRTSSGTARGTFWLTAEQPQGTLTRVREGSVLVRDLAAKRRVLVRAGERYLARERRR